jgi:hypothetical protein
MPIVAGKFGDGTAVIDPDISVALGARLNDNLRGDRRRRR